MSPLEASKDRWSLRRRLASATAGLAVLMVLVIALATVVLARMQDAQERLTVEFFEAYQLSAERFTGLVNAETAIRGYTLTGDEDSLRMLSEVTQQESDGVERIRALLADEPDVLAALDRAQASAQAWYREWGEPVVAQVRRAGVDSVSAQEVERGTVLFEQVRADNDRYLDRLVAARTDALDQLRFYTTILFVAVVLGAVTAVAAGLGLRVLLRRWVIEPLAQVAEETRAVRTGDLDHRVEGHGPPEIAALARDVDLMRLALVEQIYTVEDARTQIEAARQQLEQQAQELARSNRDLEQFAYVASHDLQEPLRKVASFCQMLERRYKGQLDERGDQYIAFAVDGAKRMQALINDLLAFSRVGRMSTGQGEVSLDDCLAQALRNLEHRIEDTGATVTADPLPTVWGEGPLLTQLFQNLVGNALKFRTEEPPQVHLGARRDGDDWQLWCADNGIGVEPQYAERIFVIFQRLHPRDEYDGTGIGLAMCKKIVEHHGGHIWLDTEVERGTTFRWTLPATRPSQLELADDEGTAGATDSAAPRSGAVVAAG